MKTYGAGSLFTLAGGLLALAQHGLAEEVCNECTVRYIVVEMPTAEAVPEVEAAAVATSVATSATATATATQRRTATYAPISPPGMDRTNPENVVPNKKVSLAYGSPVVHRSQTGEPGAKTSSQEANTDGEDDSTMGVGGIDMNLVMNKPAVALENVDAVTAVDCTSDSVTVEFGGEAAYDLAVEAWGRDGDFIVITNNMGDCDAEFERGFFVVDVVTADADSRSITCHASRDEIPSLAELLEMTFSSIPSGVHRKRVTFDPSIPISFEDSLTDDTILFSEDSFGVLRADEADFSSTFTFSGYLKYNFWGFKLDDLYFDLDTEFSADVTLSAEIHNEWSKSVDFPLGDLTYDFVDVPGIVSLGPGLAFGIGLDVRTSTGVNMTAGASLSLPNGNVHLDILDPDNNDATGWEPVFTAHASASESVEISLNTSLSVSPQLKFEFLGGLINLSSGFRAIPSLVNDFTLSADQSAGGGVLEGGWNASHGNSADKCGVTFKSDFVFDLEAFATNKWETTLYHTEIPITELCYDFEEDEVTYSY